MATAQIFLSYAREDEARVEALYQKLSEAGFDPWMDKKDILPGEQWSAAIEQGIKNSDFFMACLTANSVQKRGYIQRELKAALEIWQGKLDSDIFLIPARLEPCEMPDILAKFQWADLFSDSGWPLLLRALQEGLKRQGKTDIPTTESQPTAAPAPEDMSPTQEQQQPKQLSSADALPARYRGLIVLVGIGRPKEDPMRQSAGFAIQYHLPVVGREIGLETCWLIASAGERGSLPVAQKLQKACRSQGITAHIRTIADPFSVQEAYELVQQIYAEDVPQAGLKEYEVIADFTGGVKPMSAGMILACGDRRPMQYMTGRKGGIASIPRLIRFNPSD